MQTTSTFDYKARALAFVVGCVTGVASIPAVATTTSLFGFGLPRSYGSSSDLRDELADGHFYFYVEDSAHATPTLFRATTEREHLIASLRGMEAYENDWDGEGAKAPLIESVRAASQFVCLLAHDASMPEPMLHASGRAGLAWSEDDFYGELEFLNSDSAAYYFSRGTEKHKGIVALQSKSISPILNFLLPQA